MIETDPTVPRAEEKTVVCGEVEINSVTRDITKTMRDRLNSLGWNKIIVNFGGLLPFAHFQIVSSERFSPIVGSLLGVELGRSIMDDCAYQITGVK
jgi:methylmalonyl-CoA mutase cobalamin-binding subunit